jgi:transcriptional regulator with XRE-family HTH domain
MAHPHGKHADFESLRGQAVRLRRQGYSIRQIRDELKIFDNDILQRLVKGEPPPAWTRRPNAKDDLRERARELRLQGWTYDRIGAELGCSKSSVSLWVRDLPTPVGELSDRELFFTGVALYWAEGAKDKPHRRTEVLQFINSDPKVLGRHRRCRPVGIQQSHPETAQPPNGSQEHRRHLPRLSRDLRPAERRSVPSHGGRPVRHSRSRHSAT